MRPHHWARGRGRDHPAESAEGTQCDDIRDVEGHRRGARSVRGRSVRRSRGAGRRRRARPLRRRRYSWALRKREGRRRSRQAVLAARIHHECQDREISEAICGLHGWAGDGRRRWAFSTWPPPRRHRTHQARNARSRPRLLPRCRRHLAALACARRGRQLFRPDRADHERAGRGLCGVCRCCHAVGQAG